MMNHTGNIMGGTSLMEVLQELGVKNTTSLGKNRLPQNLTIYLVKIEI